MQMVTLRAARWQFYFEQLTLTVLSSDEYELLNKTEYTQIRG